MIENRKLVVGITGATGLVGSEVCRIIREAGFRVVPFSRRPERISGFEEVRHFSSDTAPDFTGVDAVIHLAGENIQGIWTREKKRKILESRTMGTRSVVEGIAAAGCVRTFLCASAIGFYGFQSESVLDESSEAGSGFLAEVCQKWEEEAAVAAKIPCRTCSLRIGFVLGDGGAMNLLRPVFRMGLGGRLGNGKQWMAPVHNTDLARIFVFLLQNEELSGVFNASMPEPVTNREFTSEVARAANRPAIFTVPAFALRLLLGELSDLFLGSVRVVPRRLEKCGFLFEYPTLRPALENVFAVKT